MLKLKNRSPIFRKITPAVIYSFALIFIVIFSSFSDKKHPYYISLVDVKYDMKQASLQISTRMFVNDLEDALRKTSKTNIDIINPTVKSQADSILFSYIKQRLNFTINSKKQKLSFIGYEKEEESIWAYLEIKKVPLPKKLLIDTKLLYDFIPNETNIVHVEINGVKKSCKVTNPNTKVEFNF